MKAQEESKVASLLLGFSALNKAEQASFLGNVNEFLFVSPRHRRQLIKSWRSAQESDDQGTSEHE